MELIKIASELVVGYVALLFTTKILGKTQITQITAFDFISALVLGELVGNALYDNNIGISQILFAVALWGALIYITEIITQKKKNFRAILEGKPTLVIAQGKILRDKMAENKLDMNQLQHLLRSKGAFSIREVEYAVLETDGTVSVLKKSPYELPTRQDHQMPEQLVSLPVTLILDGEVIWDNLKEFGFSEKWLKGQIQSFGAKEYKDVLYAEWQKDKGIHVQTF
ncbi:uncharacterized membrane protein YcaP (DUF421 family) [Anoxybacillus vitaminiphilus]|uniref:Uncharacterized membrane protein YcaP (DUF421 family) n=1 Tax=Paranoxybacillus vitaminiphilus TaxID=581036 RepID=A0A327Y4L7_9BACL|nr:DUF421 domain-containing protein [Anoxybacillus vitaminiphilus]RAK15331.1 uncharacterized membrane protein YcaP (DUF421 family) [Anoxybacillus vitaminiphilus]